MIDSYKVFEEWTLKKVTTQVHYLPPFLYEEYRGMTTKEVADEVHDRIRNYIAEIAGA